MDSLCFIDFETRSEVDLKSYGAWAYSCHESTEIICACVNYRDTQKSFILLRTDEIESQIEEFKLLVKECTILGVLFIVHNNFFEYSIFNNILHERFNFPYIPRSNFICTAAMAALVGLPRSLSSICVALDAPIRKDKEGKALMMRMCKPRKLTKLNRNKWIETENDILRLVQYCKIDVEATKHIYHIIEELGGTEYKVWLLDFKMNCRGIYTDSDLVKKSLKIYNKCVLLYTKELSDITNNELDNINSPSQVRMWCESQGVELDSCSKECIQQILSTDIPIKVKRVLEIRLLVSKTSVSKLKSFFSMNVGNRIRGTFYYHGAVTGRWVGKGIQPQNLPQGASDMKSLVSDIKQKEFSYFKNKYGEPIGALSDALRGCIIAPPGKQLLVSDYKSIEARVILWLANDRYGLKIFEDKKDLYIDMAATIYNIDSDKVSKKQRQLGKTAILGLGFGMGKDRFKETCKSDSMDISDDMCKEVVCKYRAKYSSIVSMWGCYELQFKHCISGGPLRKGISPCTFYPIDSRGRVRVELPSGRVITYNKCYLQEGKRYNRKVLNIMYSGVDDKTGVYTYRKLWGGDIVQHLTQAIARDIMAEAMLRLDRSGFNLVMTIHDELIAEGDPSDLDKFMLIMSKSPSWAYGIPIEVDGWSDTLYHK